MFDMNSLLLYMDFSEVFLYPIAGDTEMFARKFFAKTRL